MENYFEYFSQIEECFRRCRGTPTLLSTLDWALIESWKEAGIPLQAVLTGIERAFEKYARRPQRFRKINGLAYCSQAVLEAADALQAAQVEDSRRPSQRPARAPAAPFSIEQLQSYFRRNAHALRTAANQCETSGQTLLAGDLAEGAAALERLADETTEAPQNVQPLERQLSALEEKLVASVMRGCSADLLVDLRRQVERGIAPYRSKMNAAQIESLDRQFLKRSLLEHYDLPRLSLFYCPS
ncbi:MAG TPA: hypothetical protein VI455_08095 [Terriglobia bacterium]